MAPCAVCQAPPVNEYVFTNAGRDDCPTGFRLEYSGYLMAAAYNSYVTDYMCMDQGAVTLGSANAQIGANIYLTEPEGGSYVIPGWFRPILRAVPQFLFVF